MMKKKQLQNNRSELYFLGSVVEMKSKLIDAYMEKRDYFKSEYSLDNNQLKRVEIYTYPINNDHGRFLYITILDKTEEVHLANEIEINRKLQLRLIFLVLVVFIVFLILVFKEKEKYKRLSHYDLLTGAYSRTFLDKWLNEVKGNYKTNRKNKFVVMIDINQFKFINDEYGHLVGDQVLKFVTEILKKYTRINDLVIRFGGDEFVLIIEESKESVVYLVLDRIKSELRKNNKFNFSIEISYGVEHISDYDDLFQV